MQTNELRGPGATNQREFVFAIGLVASVILLTVMLFGVSLLDSLAVQTSATATAAIDQLDLQSERISRILEEMSQVQLARLQRGDTETLLLDMREKHELFNTTLPALQRGGLIESTHWYDNAADAHDTVQQIVDAWSRMDPQLTALLKSAALFTPAAVAAPQQEGRSINDRLRDLRQSIALGTRDHVEWLGHLRDILFVVAIFALLLVIRSLLQRVRADVAIIESRTAEALDRNAVLTRTSEELAEAKAGSDSIMETVTQGLFLMSPDFKIVGSYSKALETILRQPNLSGTNVLNLLQRLLTERTFNTTKEYFKLLFDPKKRQRTLQQINPLQRIEVNFPNPDGGYLSRYLNFSFRRIVVDGEIRRVFVAADDVTETVALETELRASESRKNRQFEFLIALLNAKPEQLDDFIKVALEQLEVVNTALRTQDFAAATSGQMSIFRQRLEVVFRAVHSIKGHAQMLNFGYFVEGCHQLESKIVGLRNRVALSGDDFLSIVMGHTELNKDIEELQTVRDQFFGMVEPRKPGRAETAGPANSDEIVAALADMAKRIAEPLAKSVTVEAAGFNSKRLETDARQAVRDALIQLTRNAVVHGIESGADRRNAGKLPAATITITGNSIGDDADRVFSFNLRDDGRGLDPEAIRAKAVAKGVIDAAAAARLPDAHVLGLIFVPGFSTAETVTDDAGRGVGLDIVKNVIVDRLGGSIRIRSEKSKYTEFAIAIPLRPAVRPSNGTAELASAL